MTITGTSKQFVRIGDEWQPDKFKLCPSCGATVYWAAEGREEYIAIPVGAFAELKFPGPTLSGYEERMHSWVQMPEDIKHMP